MICKNLKELEKELRKRIDVAMLTDVAQAASDVMIDHIQQDVYDVYEPFYYDRRYDDGGLADPNNIVSSIEGNTLIIENYTLGNQYVGGYWGISKNTDKPISNIIETGIGYDTRFNMKRPFMKNTIYDLATNKYHVKALKQGLTKLGLEVR